MRIPMNHFERVRLEHRIKVALEIPGFYEMHNLSLAREYVSLLKDTPGFAGLVCVEVGAQTQYLVLPTNLQKLKSYLFANRDRLNAQVKEHADAMYFLDVYSLQLKGRQPL